MIKECSCKKCIKCCWNSCGWFGSTEEIEGAAKIMDMNIADFCKEYLIREWWAGDDDIDVPAPRKDFNRTNEQAATNILKKAGLDISIFQEEINKNGKGFVRASWGHNLMIGYPCIFLDKNNKCMIHKSKPTECRESFGCNPSNFKREGLLSYWKEHQGWIGEIIKKIGS